MQEIINNISSINWKTAVPFGTQTRIAKKHKVSSAFVNMVLAGKKQNVGILRDMLKEAVKHKEDQSQISDELNSMIAKLN